MKHIISEEELKDYIHEWEIACCSSKRLFARYDVNKGIAVFIVNDRINNKYEQSNFLENAVDAYNKLD